MTELVKLIIEDNIGIIVIDNPPVNVLNSTVIDEMDIVLSQVENTPEIKVIILTGAGTKAFIAGADIKSMPSLDYKSGELLAQKGQALTLKLENMPKVSIAAINGVALGGGLEFAMACDIRICGETVKLGQPEINLGIIPGYGGTQRLSRLVGISKAKELILTGDPITGEEALKIGLVNKVVKNEEVLNTAKEMAKKIASKGQIAVHCARDAINKGYNMSLKDSLTLEAMYFGKVCTTEDKNEGVNAFIEKRQPKFQDK